jgi:class 3 adenylate cyclase/pSer/pThr/pTyr-binding forkhead associated (FHA) protein
MSPENSVTEIISAARKNPALMSELERFRRDVTVMFTDIKGSTSYFEKHGDVAGMMMVDECNELLRKCVEARRGHVVKTIGDSVMAIFDDSAEAVRAAIEMQDAMVRFNAPKPPSDWIAIRIGLNYGSGIVKTNDVFGDVVNVASRVESVTQAEQIVISDTVRERVLQHREIRLSHIGRFALKGKEESRDLYEVIWQAKATPIPSHTTVHTLVSVAKALRVRSFRVQHLKQDGSVGTEKNVTTGILTVGSKKGEWTFPGDPELAAEHARFAVEGDQVVVHDLSGSRGVFVRLISVYTLQEGDEVVMGNQVFAFHEKPLAMAAAAMTGTQLVDLSQILNEPVAELVGGTTGDKKHFPLSDDSVSWGRSKGTYTFPDDRFMSGAHCRIYQRGENFFLEDMGSRNGTFVRVREKAPVPTGSSVRVGGQILRVQM